jgi:hypothetical protein
MENCTNEEIVLATCVDMETLFLWILRRSQCEILAFLRGIVEVFALLGHYGAYVCRWSLTFGTTQHSHLRESSSYSSLSAWAFNMGPECCPETSVTNYQSRHHNILEERSSIPQSGFRLRFGQAVFGLWVKIIAFWSANVLVRQPLKSYWMCLLYDVNIHEYTWWTPLYYTSAFLRKYL